MTMEIIYGMPLILIIALSVIVLLVDAFTGKNKAIAYYFTILSLIVVGISAAFTINVSPEQLKIDTPITGDSVVFGGYAAFFDIIFCVAGLLTLFSAKNYMLKEYEEYKEYY